MKIVKIVCALLLVALWCVPAVSASGMVKFHIPEAVEAKVGDTVTVTIYNDNNLKPQMADLSLYDDWNMEVLKFESSEFKQGRTTVANLVGLHNINIRAGETTNGFPQGDNPLIELKYKVIGPGYTPIMIKVDRVHDLDGTDITSKAVVKHGSITGTGKALPTTTVTATAATTAPAGTPTTGKTTTATTVATSVPTSVPTTAGTIAPVTPLPTSLPTTAPTSAIKPPVTAVPIVPGSATVPAGTGIFSVSSVGNVPVGGMGTVQVAVDNAWTPLFADTYIDITFDPSMIKYQYSSIEVANTTSTAQGEGKVRLMLGDFRNGYPQGKYPIADVTFTSLREGSTPLAVSVDHVRYWNSDFTQFTDISSSASTQNGIFSTGPIDGVVPTLVPVTGNPEVTYDTLTPATTYQTSAPVSSSGGSLGSDEYTGVRTKTVTPTPTPTVNATVNTTVPTLPPTAVMTVETPFETPVQLELQTTVPPTTVTTTATPTPTPTPTKSALPFGVLALVALAGAALAIQRTRR